MLRGPEPRSHLLPARLDSFRAEADAAMRDAPEIPDPLRPLSLGES